MFTFEKIYSKGKGAFSRYLREEFLLNDYYNENDSVTGYWFGLGAKLLGIHGQAIQGEDPIMQSLADNRVPDSLKVVGKEPGQRMTVRHKENRPSMFDFTCSAPKGVSVAAITGDHHKLFEAHRKANKIAMSELQLFVGRRHNGKIKHTENMIACQYLHTCSRSQDPEMHTHNGIFNMTYDTSENQWYGLTEVHMCQAMAYATRVYQNTLAQECIGLGYDIQLLKDQKGRIYGFDLAEHHVPKNVREIFSKRAQAIDQIIKDREKQNEALSLADKKAISLELRPDKNVSMSREERMQYQVSQMSDEDCMRIRQKPSGKEPGKLIDQEQTTPENAISWATQHITERKATFTEKELIFHALRFTGQFTLPEVKEAAKKSSEVNAIGHDKNGIEIFSTCEHIEMEKRSVAWVQNSAEKYPPASNLEVNPFEELIDGAVRKNIRETGTAREKLLYKATRQQAFAIRRILKNENVCSIFRGGPGTGKTFTLTELDKHLKNAGWKTAYCAPTTKARNILRDDGFTKAETLKMFFKRWEKQSDNSMQNTFVIIDESSFLSQLDGFELENAQRRLGFRILFSGDTKQLPGVGGGEYLKFLEEHTTIQKCEITITIRQSKSADREAVEAFQESPREGFGQLDALGYVQESGDYLEKAARQFVNHYQKAAKNKKDQQDEPILVTLTWEEINALTSIIRPLLKKRKLLEDEGTERSVIESLKWTKSEIRSVNSYQKGLIIDNGRGGQMEVLEVLTDKLLVQFSDGRKSLRNPKQFTELFDVGKKRKLEVCVGEKILIQRNLRNGQNTLSNGDEYTVVKILKNGDFKIRSRQGTTKTLDKDFFHFTYAYAGTAHRMQGETRGIAIFALSRADDRAALVGVSRHKSKLEIYTPCKQKVYNDLPAETSFEPSAHDYLTQQITKETNKEQNLEQPNQAPDHHPNPSSTELQVEGDRDSWNKGQDMDIGR